MVINLCLCSHGFKWHFKAPNICSDFRLGSQSNFYLYPSVDHSLALHFLVSFQAWDCMILVPDVVVPVSQRRSRDAHETEISFQISALAGVWTSDLALWWPRTLPLEYDCMTHPLYLMIKQTICVQTWLFLNHLVVGPPSSVLPATLNIVTLPDITSLCSYKIAVLADKCVDRPFWVPIVFQCTIHVSMLNMPILPMYYYVLFCS